MKKHTSGNKSLRTRKDLLLAAARLLKAGSSPSMDDVAKEALVSRATAYRYFSDVKDLLVEVPVDEAVPAARDIFTTLPSERIEDRIDHAEAVMHETVYRNETQLRLMLSQSLNRSKLDDAAPVRQNRRTEYIEAALAPYKKKLTKDVYGKLCAALALVFGTEGMIVFRDVVPLEPKQARKVKSWAVRALVKAAIDQSSK